MKITWKKNISNDFKLFNNESQIGILKSENYLDGSVFGNIENEKYSFKRKNIFENQSIIIDKTQNRQIGIIKYGIWNNKADIFVNDLKYTWKYNNVWNSEWYIEDSNGEKINFKSNFFKGTVLTNENDALKILLGLYIYRYYQRNTFIIFFIIFLPTIMRMLN
jgi:hypothetical protein